MYLLQWKNSICAVCLSAIFAQGFQVAFATEALPPQPMTSPDAARLNAYRGLAPTGDSGAMRDRENALRTLSDQMRPQIHEVSLRIENLRKRYNEFSKWADNSNFWCGSDRAFKDKNSSKSLQPCSAEEKETGRANSQRTLTAEANSVQQMAKQILDNVKSITGIDPKARLRKKIPVSLVFPKQAQSFKDLAPRDQEAVVVEVRDSFGELYLDLINLSKQAVLIQTQAYALGFRVKFGSLSNEDRVKFIGDLAMAALYPIPIVDQNQNEMVILDRDIASEDHIYEFNKRLSSEIRLTPDLQISENEFQVYIANLSDWMVANKQTFKGKEAPKPQTAEMIALEAAKKTENAPQKAYDPNANSSIAFESALNCIQMTAGQYDNESQLLARMSCLKPIAPKLESYNRCIQLVDLSKYDRYCRLVVDPTSGIVRIRGSSCEEIQNLKSRENIAYFMADLQKLCDRTFNKPSAGGSANSDFLERPSKDPSLKVKRNKN